MSERDLVDELLRAQVKTKLFGGDHAPRLGRLVILEPLGSGGMGSVFAAYDPRLDRRVAVKLLRGERAAAEKVLREARALGKLAHPNVVAVHDATETDGVVSIVMELAPGESLRKWMASGRSWREVLAVMQQAGAGLAAAHRAGIIHRDVKPDNIVIGPDRARLVDFGLAGAQAGDTERPVEVDPGEGGSPAMSIEHGGTPGYMAPEVLAGAPANAYSDQFGFAVTLFEALYGARPHRAERKGELADAARRAAEAKPPANTEVPGWVHQVVARALSPAPEARFPSMDAMVAELGRDRRGRRRLALAGAAFALLAAGVGAFGYARGASRDVCGGAEVRVEAAWSRAEMERARETLGDAPWSMKTLEDLAALANAWKASYRRVCEATRVHGGQPDRLLELRMRCLDRRLDRMTALGHALAGNLEPEARENASAAVAALQRPERCETLTDPGELALPDNPESRARVERAGQEMDRAWTSYALGRYREARETAAAIDASTADLAFAPLRAPLWLLLGAIEARLGDAAQARARLEAALREAANAHAGGVELEIWARLLRNELFSGNRGNVIEWAPFARAAAARNGAAGAEIDGIVAEALRDAGELAPARQMLGAALASHDELRGDQRALLEMNLGSVELAAGKPRAAEEAFTRAAALADAALGKGHPGLGLYLDKLAATSRARGRMSEALARHQEALRLRELAYGERDRAVATTLLRRAQTRVEAGQLAAAEEDLHRAREIRTAVHGKDHSRLGEVDMALGAARAARGDRGQAIVLYERAASLDRQLDVGAALVDAGKPVDPSALRPLGRDAELSTETAQLAAARVRRLRDAGPLAAAKQEAAALASRWRDAGQDVAAPVSNRVGEALRAVGRDAEAADAFEAALTALADEPSRERLRALTGLAEGADRGRAQQAAAEAIRLLEAMPELDRSAGSGLLRIAGGMSR